MSKHLGFIPNTELDLNSCYNIQDRQENQKLLFFNFIIIVFKLLSNVFYWFRKNRCHPRTSNAFPETFFFLIDVLWFKRNKKMNYLV